MTDHTPISECCSRCGRHGLKLSYSFVNGLGWRERCASCLVLDESRSGPRAYTGPLPFSSYRNPCTVTLDGREIGTVTSISFSPRGDAA